MKSGLDEVILAEIACNANADIEDVRRAYHSIVGNLRENAKIHDYIPLLAMNRVREHFRTTPKLALTHQGDEMCIDIGREKATQNLELLVAKYAQ